MNAHQQVRRQERLVASFNERIAIGDPVYYRKDDGSIVETMTRTEASMLSGHTSVVWLTGVPGCVSTERVARRRAA